MHRASKRIVIAIAIVAVAFCATAFVVDRYTLSATYARVPDRALSLMPTYEDYADSCPRTDVQFQLDGYTVRGHVYAPENTRGLVIFRHGIFSQHSDYLPLITALAQKGWRVFAYDAIGCGESDGESTLGMSQSPLDVAAAIDFVRESGMAKDMPIALWGHSWGGYGVAAALGLRDGIDACVSMSGYDTPLKVLTYSATSSFGPIGSVQEPFLWLNTAIDFGDNANLSASDAIAASGTPTLVIHGAHDTTVPCDTTSIFGTLRENGADTGNVRCQVKESEGRDGHNNYFYSPDSQAYLNECTDALQQMLDENGDDASAPEVRDYVANVDKLAANTADPALIDEIDSFLARSCDSGSIPHA